MTISQQRMAGFLFSSLKNRKEVIKMTSGLRITGIAYEELVEVVEILGRSSTGTVTFRDQKGRVHIKQRPIEPAFNQKGGISIKQLPIELGDKFIATITMGNAKIIERSIFDDFMFE